MIMGKSSSDKYRMNFRINDMYIWRVREVVMYAIGHLELGDIMIFFLI